VLIILPMMMDSVACAIAIIVLSILNMIIGAANVNALPANIQNAYKILLALLIIGAEGKLLTCLLIE
jgi:hypothetical protein